MIKDFSDTDKYVVNPIDAANYLIQLYFRTNKKYNCNITKVEQLLCIYYLWCLSRNTDSFYMMNELIPSKSGFTILNIRMFFCTDIINGTEKENNSYIDDLLDDVNIPILYSTKYQEPSSETKDLLLQIFRHFGNYDIRDLANFFDEIKKHVIKDSQISVIELKRIISNTPEIPLMECNEILSFLNNGIIDLISKFNDDCSKCMKKLYK